jgi:V/A-type H+-transporting ATPase subunit I
LLALGLTSTVIGMIINIIALLSKDIPFVGWIVMIFILIIGHLFNVIISTLGAFIHSARLQLVEFFGKFFEGGGKAFKPFKRDTKYSLIK